MKAEETIAKLSRLTVARGATPAEAQRAQEKIHDIRQRVQRERLAALAVLQRAPRYVEGWPGETYCQHRHWIMEPRTGMSYCQDCRKQFIQEVKVDNPDCQHPEHARIAVRGRWYCKLCGDHI